MVIEFRLRSTTATCTELAEVSRDNVQDLRIYRMIPKKLGFKLGQKLRETCYNQSINFKGQGFGYDYRTTTG